jgi:hypothetical protein
VLQKNAAAPVLFQINTRVLLTGLSRTRAQPATLDDVPDIYLDRLAQQGFNWVWFLGVWQTGPAGRKVSAERVDWRSEFQKIIPDLADSDVSGSCFAIQSYSVHSEFGGDAAIDRMRSRLHNRGMCLMLDFVPNHTAPDHPWVREHPEYYVHGTEAQLSDQPQNYTRVMLPDGSAILAYGRDPYFPGWPDTLQLNYANPALQEAMATELGRIAALCDAVRCDMAMLVMPDVFERTWGLRAPSFWPMAIAKTRAQHPDFLLMAEAYWDLEWALQQQGFDYTYDKRLYDRLREGSARPVRDHFRADLNFQRKSARFLENHDEPRAAAVFPAERYGAAAVLTYMCPGLRFFHQGQAEGFRQKIPVHLSRGPAETVNPDIRQFYKCLLDCLERPCTRNGEWQLLDSGPAWDGNWTSDCFICFSWSQGNKPSLIAAVNYAPNRSQCYLHLPGGGLQGKKLRFRDLMGSAVYERDGDDISARGLYLDMPAWGFHVFELKVR